MNAPNLDRFTESPRPWRQPDSDEDDAERIARRERRIAADADRLRDLFDRLPNYQPSDGQLDLLHLCCPTYWLVDAGLLLRQPSARWGYCYTPGPRLLTPFRAALDYEI